MAVVAALRVAQAAGAGAVVVVLLPDGGRGYLSKIFNDDWMARYGFLSSHTAEGTVGDVLAAKGSGMWSWCTCTRSRRSANAIHLFREYGVSQVPVLKAEPPVVTGEVAGSIAEKAAGPLFGGGRTCTTRSNGTWRAAADDRWGPAGRRGGGAAGALRRGPGAGRRKPVGVITRQDLLIHLGTG